MRSSSSRLSSVSSRGLPLASTRTTEGSPSRRNSQDIPIDPALLGDQYDLEDDLADAEGEIVDEDLEPVFVQPVGFRFPEYIETGRADDLTPCSARRFFPSPPFSFTYSLAISFTLTPSIPLQVRKTTSCFVVQAFFGKL